MEQMYLIEIFVDKLTLYVPDDQCGMSGDPDRKYIIRTKFGPKIEFLIKEGQIVYEKGAIPDVEEVREDGQRIFTRSIRAGKSILFASYADVMWKVLSTFPLEIQVWNDDDMEPDIFVGVGTVYWDKRFYEFVRDSADPCLPVAPKTVKQTTPIYAECCCSKAGELSFIFRMSVVGESIITEFQQLMRDPDCFVFRTDKVPNMYECKRVDGDNETFKDVASLYESTIASEPACLKGTRARMEICTGKMVCSHGKDIEACGLHGKVKMGDISGPCGNPRCPIAHKVKTYIRNLDVYKQNAQGVCGKKPPKSPCGTCACKKDRQGPLKSNAPRVKELTPLKICTICDDTTGRVKDCYDRLEQYNCDYMFETTRGSKSLPIIKEKTVPCGCSSSFFSESEDDDRSGCGSCASSKTTGGGMKNDHLVYNVELNPCKRHGAMCMISDWPPNNKNCTCHPPKLTPACAGANCECSDKHNQAASRKDHRPYCPAYQHKMTCPILKEQLGITETKDEDEEEEETLPYGLSPIQLGPCPVQCRPCTYPDGFNRMYKNAVLASMPPYDSLDPPHCSKPYELIKRALKEYMTSKQDDYRCYNRFHDETGRKCCDKGPRFAPMPGTSCCSDKLPGGASCCKK